MYLSPPLWWIALTSVVALVISLVVVLWQFRELSLKEAVIIASLVGLSVFLWRACGNIKELNDDQLPPFSPNDLLSPVITYMVLGVYVGLRPAVCTIKDWNQARAWLTVLTMLVNVVTI